jgi:hypothetical protein
MIGMSVLTGTLLPENLAANPQAAPPELILSCLVFPFSPDPLRLLN